MWENTWDMGWRRGVPREQSDKRQHKLWLDSRRSKKIRRKTKFLECKDDDERFSTFRFDVAFQKSRHNVSVCVSCLVYLIFLKCQQGAFLIISMTTILKSYNKHSKCLQFFKLTGSEPEEVSENEIFDNGELMFLRSTGQAQSCEAHSSFLWWWNSWMSRN